MKIIYNIINAETGMCYCSKCSKYERLTDGDYECGFVEFIEVCNARTRVWRHRGHPQFVQRNFA